MKTVLIFFTLLICGNLTAQTNVEFLNSVGKQDFANIESHLATNVTYCVNDNQKRVNRSTAISELESFMNNKKVVQFKILHNGKSSDQSSSYRVARMKTQSGTYRIFAYSEISNGETKVIEIRIDSM